MRSYVTALFLLVASPSFADTNTNNGAGNTINNNSGNVGTGANSPITAIGSGGSAKAYGGNASQHQGQYQGQSQNAKSSVKSSGNSSNSYSNDQAASTAYAAPLVASDSDTCMGSSSGGAQGMGFGLSVGSTWQDKDCVRRKDSRELHNMGLKGASIALMCQNDDVYAAMETAGTPCPESVEPRIAEPQDTVYEYPTSRH